MYDTHRRTIEGRKRCMVVGEIRGIINSYEHFPDRRHVKMDLAQSHYVHKFLMQWHSVANTGEKILGNLKLMHIVRQINKWFCHCMSSNVVAPFAVFFIFLGSDILFQSEGNGGNYGSKRATLKFWKVKFVNKSQAYMQFFFIFRTKWAKTFCGNAIKYLWLVFDIFDLHVSWFELFLRIFGQKCHKPWSTFFSFIRPKYNTIKPKSLLIFPHKIKPKKMSTLARHFIWEKVPKWIFLF